MSRLGALLVLALAAVLVSVGSTDAPTAASNPDPHAGSPIGAVIRVPDGDTIVVALDAGEETVRLLGVDTPETHHPHRDVEPYGKEAARFTRNLLLEESVYVVRDETMPEHDRHGRLLAYVYRASDGLFVNEELVRQGYARVYEGRPCKHVDEFQELERRAHAAGKGLWGEPQPVSAGAAASPALDMAVYVARTGTKYHRSECPHLRRGRTAIQLSEARRRYVPCARCSPPK